MKKKRESCKYCGEKMEAKTTRQEYCSDKCRVYFSRENPIFKIYSLSHPVTEQVFYIGKTQRELKHRLGSHIADIGAKTEGRGAKKVEIIKSILSEGMKPKITLLETTHLKSVNEQSDIELYWIDYYISNGHPITNFQHNRQAVSERKELSKEAKIASGISKRSLATILNRQKHPLWKEGDPSENSMSFLRKYDCMNYKELEIKQGTGS